MVFAGKEKSTPLMMVPCLGCAVADMTGSTVRGMLEVEEVETSLEGDACKAGEPLRGRWESAKQC